MEQGGVFEGFEFRTGGSPDTRKNQVVIRLGTDGWRRETVLLDEFQGKRDITEIIAAKITRDSAEREPQIERDDVPERSDDDIPF